LNFNWITLCCIFHPKNIADHYQIEDVNKVQSGHIRQYIKYLRDRGKYTGGITYIWGRNDYGQLGDGTKRE
jgi:hypothetical protein